MGRIPEVLLQEILDKTNFISLYQEKLRLIKKGSKWWGLCPFHAEKTPSFSIDAERGLFYCFGCQKGGSIIDFLMETEKLSFIEAVEELARRAQITIPADDGFSEKEDSERSQILELNEKLATAFHWLLLMHDSGAKAHSILNSRGIPDTTIKDFRLGYAPADTSWLHRFLGTKGYSAGFLTRTGLFAARNPRFPLFADRIIFPIADQRGRVIAFGGRLISGDGPKYLNSPDTVVFHKQENLFAFDKALPSIKESNTAIVCEGYMDALSFHVAGVKSAVAPLGTAFTIKQAQLLRRRAEKVLLCFDSDQAGVKAAERSCPIAAQAGIDASVVLMREGKDASEILEKLGSEALKKIPEYSISGGDFLIGRAEELFDWGTMEGKSKAASFFYPYLDAIDSEVKRDAFLEIVGRRMGINSTALLADYQKAKALAGGRTYHGDAQAAAQAKRAVTMARTADLLFMTAVVLKPESFPALRESLSKDDLDDPRAVDLYVALDEAWSKETRDTAAVISLLETEGLKSFVLSAAGSGEFDQSLDAIIADGMKAVRMRSLERERDRLSLDIGRSSRAASKTEGRPSDPEILVELLKQKMQLDLQIARIKGEVDE
ncbi:MAG: DNA primase [Spirochaetes bacterium]|nr:DNA primase [Spirochaetota bacterium]